MHSNCREIKRVRSRRLWLSIVIIVLEALIRPKRNTSEKLMISRLSRRDVSFPQGSALYFPSVCKNPTRLEVLELLVAHASLSAVFDEADENLIACLGVCYVLNGAHRLDSPLSATFRDTRWISRVLAAPGFLWTAKHATRRINTFVVLFITLLHPFNYNRHSSMLSCIQYAF